MILILPKIRNRRTEARLNTKEAPQAYHDGGSAEERTTDDPRGKGVAGGLTTRRTRREAIMTSVCASVRGKELEAIPMFVLGAVQPIRDHVQQQRVRAALEQRTIACAAISSLVSTPLRSRQLVTHLVHTLFFMTSSSSPFGTFFKSQPSLEDVSNTTNSKSRKKDKTATVSNETSRSGLLSSLFPNSSSSSTSSNAPAPSYNMLMLPPALFPSYSRPLPTPPTPSSGKSPKLKHGLFSKAKKHPKNPIATSERRPDQESTGWRLGGWGSRGESPQEHEIQNISADISDPSDTKGFRGRLRMIKASKPDMDVTVIQHQEDLTVDSQTKATKMLAIKCSRHCNVGIEKSSAGQIMLHPSYNLSKGNDVSSRSSSPTPLPMDQSMTTSVYQEQRCSCQVYHQQYYQSQQRPPKAGVTLAIHDILGIGKAAEMTVALFLAHDSFLSRRPPLVQYVIMTWEATVVLLIIWSILRVIGLAEVVVWRADDLVGGILSLIWGIGRVLRAVVVR